MNRYPVQGTNIVSIGYDEENLILEIEFKLQAMHQYFDVPLDEFVALMRATQTEKYYFEFIYSCYHFDVF